MLVIDSSALLAALTADRRDDSLVSRLGSVPELYAPQLLDIELLHVLRRLVATGTLSANRAQRMREDFSALRVRRYPHEPLLDRVWELRGALTPSDAVFVVLAEALEVPLVTCDPHLATPAGHAAQVEVFGRPTSTAPLRTG
jgi:predicted nucleic acid-binding protein